MLQRFILLYLERPPALLTHLLEDLSGIHDLYVGILSPGAGSPVGSVPECAHLASGLLVLGIAPPGND